MFILFEHASGYALFAVKQYEEISAQMAAVEKNAMDFGKFSSLVYLHAYVPFDNSETALQECIAISEGKLPPTLLNFLENNLPLVGDPKVTLGVGDPKLGQAVCEQVSGVKCIHTDVVPELLRGIRYHLSKYLKKMDVTSERGAQLGLGHGLARETVQFNVNRVDNMIMQAIALVDQMDKNINNFGMRIREWYSYHFPELYKIIPDIYSYCKCAHVIGDRAQLTTDKLSELVEILGDEEKSDEIMEAARNSIGMDIDIVDLMNVNRFCVRVMELVQYRKGLLTYLKNRMGNCAPNLSAVVGEQIGARLISQAGSLNNLAKYPASTIQILGAEKALFRALRRRGNTPKYGLLFHCSYIGRAAAKDKGKISRFVANKCALASRIDCFSELPVSTFGEHLRTQIEERLKLFETGATPRKNVDVMREAIAEAKEQQAILLKKMRKAKKKAAKAALAQSADGNEEVGDVNDSSALNGSLTEVKSKKKKRESEGSKDANVSAPQLDVDLEKPAKKKKRKLDASI